MEVITACLFLKTKGHTDIINITEKIEKEIENCSLNDGIITIFIPGATGGITTIEYEEGLIKDLKTFFEEILPSYKEYHHNLKWKDYNGHSHLQASLLGPSLTIPFSHKSLQLGKWQQIIFIDFDNRPRERKLILQIIGK